MRIDTDGNAGIGTSSPGAKLHTSHTALAFIAQTSGQTTAATISSGGSAGIVDVLNLRAVGNGGVGRGTGILFEQPSGAGSFAAAARVAAYDSGLSLYTGATPLERMRIDSAGNVGIGTSNPGYKLEVNGSFAAISKSFVIPHPTKEGKKLRHGSLEGPENGVYIRGKLKSKSQIELPEYWTKLVDPDSITVTLTPIGKHQKLYVEEISDNVVTVGNDGFAGEINCFFVVYGERVDIDKLVVEIE
jgi:hypothetical protein